MPFISFHFSRKVDSHSCGNWVQMRNCDSFALWWECAKNPSSMITINKHLYMTDNLKDKWKINVLAADAWRIPELFHVQFMKSCFCIDSVTKDCFKVTIKKCPWENRRFSTCHMKHIIDHVAAYSTLINNMDTFTGLLHGASLTSVYQR